MSFSITFFGRDGFERMWSATARALIVREMLPLQQEFE
jgi:hypothetical protein